MPCNNQTAHHFSVTRVQWACSRAEKSAILKKMIHNCKITSTTQCVGEGYVGVRSQFNFKQFVAEQFVFRWLKTLFMSVTIGVSQGHNHEPITTDFFPQSAFQTLAWWQHSVNLTRLCMVITSVESCPLVQVSDFSFMTTSCEHDQTVHGNNLCWVVSSCAGFSSLGPFWRSQENKRN